VDGGLKTSDTILFVPNIFIMPTFYEAVTEFYRFFENDVTEEVRA
jgi:hypothetical protein